MTFKARVFDEPVLEFGDGGQHCDPRQGLREFGPLQPRSGDVVNVGVIGTDDTVSGFTEFLNETARGIESENKQLINLNPDFPGLGNQNPFRCKFVVPDGATVTVSRSQVNEIRAIGRHDEAVRQAVEMVSQQLWALNESSVKPDVIVLALPIPLIEKLVNAKSEDAEPKEEDQEEEDSDILLDFRDLLKAKTLHLDVPTQIVWPDTWDDAAKIPRKVKRESNRQVQLKATRAWNLLNALFYKAGKVPWRLLPQADGLRTSYLGIGFYRDVDGQQLWTSTAQMFDERGRGLILRGARAQTETKGRHPYLTEQDADDLVTQSIATYKTHHRHVPARLVILKTSRFRPEEAKGIDAALRRAGIDLSDLVWVQESSPIAVFRDGNYPVLRGTFIDLRGKGLLYTRGSVPYYGTFPGLRVPRPLLLVPHENCDTAISKLAEEILALTKVNWNTTQFDLKLPAPIMAAREVGHILKHIDFGTPISPDFRKYT
ncbi:argonaute/piwi family protein [Bradyrhizobium betae]|uniref:argonaute/piwi family protein n=1 Tax=Bradyrhizobium betae TaxID=244734 RepID=UPI003D66910E